MAIIETLLAMEGQRIDCSLMSNELNTFHMAGMAQRPDLYLAVLQLKPYRAKNALGTQKTPSSLPPSYSKTFQLDFASQDSNSEEQKACFSMNSNKPNDQKINLEKPKNPSKQAR